MSTTPMSIIADRAASATPVPSTAPGAASAGPWERHDICFTSDREVIRARRRERYSLQDTARQILLAHGRELGLEHPADVHRTAKCRVVPRAPVRVLFDREHGAAHYGGLITCGSVWSCPICAATIQERRREEIARAFDWAYSAGHKIVLLTLTFPHTAWDDLGAMLAQQAEALRRLRSGKAWQQLKSRIGFRGLIRALEVTHGEHGWHPHTHEAWVIDADADVESLREYVTARWAASCRAAGLLPPDREKAFAEHAVHLIDRAHCSDYLAKGGISWGADRELAKASTKRGSSDGTGRHPFDLLRDAQGGDRQAARLFLEYSMALRGRRQLYWSRGLKALVGIAELTDEQLAEEARESAELLGQMSPAVWQAVCRAGARAHVLDAAEVGGWAAVQVIIRECLELDGERSPP